MKLMRLNDVDRSPEERLAALLQLPHSGETVQYRNGHYYGTRTVSQIPESDGILLFTPHPASHTSISQQQHYDKIAKAYLENLEYPHTKEYNQYLDNAFIGATHDQHLGVAAELCCGSGEAFSLLKSQIDIGIGIDISHNMLIKARTSHPEANFCFTQADVTQLPIKDNCIDTVLILGGIHHVPDRDQLFKEVYRVLKPGGKFFWREPVSDFFLWRWLRAIIYRLSPMLEHESERPLEYPETAPVLARNGLRLIRWDTLGFIGFCLLMNSDVLYFNRWFRFIPGIKRITRFFIKLDQLMLRIPGLRNAGLQVVGVASKPEQVK